MKPVVWFTVIAIALPVASAIALASRSTKPRVFSVDIEKRSIPDVVMYETARRSRLLKRQNIVKETVTINDAQTLYYANITLGTPPQRLALHVDTGSSDVWVNAANTPYCSQPEINCEGGAYDMEVSSTAQYVNSHFNITYADGSGATGFYIKDTLGFVDVQVDNFQFGLGTSSNAKQGVLGLGYALNEVQVQAGDKPYRNLPQALFDNGHINRNAYSLWLNSRDTNSGHILFGGINTAKYTGELRKIPVLKQKGGNIGFFVALSSIRYNDSPIVSRSMPASVLLDSGSTISYLPNDIVDTLYRTFGVEYNDNNSLGYASCSLAGHDAYLEFGFGEVTIQVPFSELVLNMGTYRRGTERVLSNGDRACLFGIAPGDNLSILGDTFLRSAYVVYDLELNEISLAQTDFNAAAADEGDVREICVWQRRGPWCHG